MKNRQIREFEFKKIELTVFSNIFNSEMRLEIMSYVTYDTLPIIL